MEIIELLLKQGILTPEQIEAAKKESKRTGLNLEKALEKLGLINEEDIARARADEMDVPYMDLNDYIIDASLVELIPEKLAKKYRAVPLFKIAGTLTVAMVDPGNIEALDQIRKISKAAAIEPVLASEKGVQKIINSYYEAAGSAEDIIKCLIKENPSAKAKATAAEAAEEAPIIKLVNIMITEAVKDRASDIHIEPEQEEVRARYRVDGVLYEWHIFPKKTQNAIISRIKVLAGMDIAESRKPQDGKIRLKIENKDLDIRVSAFPTVHGENVVMRLLDKSSILLSLQDLGFSDDNLAAFEKLIKQPNGIILVTGPTGSGKTTTLYAALATISTMAKNIITIEDPVEYELPLIRQTPVNPKADMTFANGLRSILRQDPDVIMVGEIRDKETAEIAIQASMTGHLVFSTLHTNDAPSSLTRLMDMGVEPFLISSSVSGILAQRLVRKICPKCKEKYTPAGSILKDSGAAGEQEFYRGKGCDNCKKTGFMGRIGIFEFLLVNEEIKKMINDKSSADQIRKKAVEMGMKPLRQDGLEKVKAGFTTLEEVVRVTQT
ncbi:MAG: type II secretion system ATPase GspE [Candidatus Omnitrophota bacterium]